MMDRIAYQGVQKLSYGKLTENLIEITLTYSAMLTRHPELTDIPSDNWKEEFVDMANEFEEKHKDYDWLQDDYGYLDAITVFAKQKIGEYAGWNPFFFTFGNAKHFPFRNTYLIVFAESEQEAINKFRSHIPDVYPGVVNCAFWYNKERWKKDGMYKDARPAAIID